MAKMLLAAASFFTSAYLDPVVISTNYKGEDSQ